MDSRILYLTPLFFFLIPSAYGEIGNNYDRVQLDELTYQWTSHPERILDPFDNSWKDWIISEDSSIIQIESMRGSYVFDKNNCSISFFNAGKINPEDIPIIGSDSYSAKVSTDGITFNDITQINDAACQTSLNTNSTHAVIEGTKQTSLGSFTVQYVKEVGKDLKTNLIAVNNAGVSRYLGVTQTLAVPQFVNFGGVQRDLSNFDGQSFNHDWLVSNKAELIKLTDKVNFDLFLALSHVEDVSISWDGTQARLHVNYFRNPPLLNDGDQIRIDPTFGWSATSEKYRVYDAATVSASCSGTVDTKDTTMTLSYTASGSSGRCQPLAFQWDITSIPDYATIDDTQFRIDIDSTSNIDCQGYNMHEDLATASNQDIWDDMTDGNQYFSSWTACNTTGNQKQIDLGATADTDLQSQLASNVFGISLLKDTHDREASTLNLGISDPELTVTYSLTPKNDATINAAQTIGNVGDVFKIDGTIFIKNSSNTVNITSIVVRNNGTIVNTNGTDHNQTAPYKIDYGPFWVLISVDTPRNITTTVYTQANHTNAANETKGYKTREYDPSYFTAQVASEGDVNYTKEGATLKVNRDKGGNTFSIECSSVAHSDLLQINFNKSHTTTKTWYNFSNVGYFKQDIANTGPQFVECYNDNLLFSTTMYGNNTLALGVGLFDGIGGIFGLPAVSFLLLAVFSMATNRNFPTILVIGLGTAGILGSLGLLALSGGVWGLILVIGAIGILSLRKAF